MSDRPIEFTRDLYKQVKHMNREQLSDLCSDFYNTGYDKGFKDGSSIDFDKLRENLGSIKGVGESRLNEIMTIFQDTLKIEISDESVGDERQSDKS